MLVYTLEVRGQLVGTRSLHHVCVCLCARVRLHACRSLGLNSGYLAALGPNGAALLCRLSYRGIGSVAQTGITELYLLLPYLYLLSVAAKPALGFLVCLRQVLTV